MQVAIYLLAIVKSFVEINRFLLSQPGAQGGLFFLSERISQDPLENYIGMQHSRGHRSGDPNLKECSCNQGLEIVGIGQSTGNRRQNGLLSNDDFKVKKDDEASMPKRKRHKKSQLMILSELM